MQAGIEDWPTNRKRPPREETTPTAAFPPRPLPHSRPAPAPFTQTPPRVLPWWSGLLYPGNNTQTTSVSFSQSTKIIKKNKKTKNPTRSRKRILIKQGNSKLPPQSTGVRRLKGKARVCGARGPAAGGGARKALRNGSDARLWSSRASGGF